MVTLQRWIENALPGHRAQSARAAQAYMEDPTKVEPQTRHGHSNSFGTIGATLEERVQFWNDVHEHEREKDARTQNRLVLELPHEASAAARQEIVKRFCQEFERLGVPYWASIHAPTKNNDDRNHHAHIIYSNRPAKKMVHPGTGKLEWDFTIVETYTKKNRVRKTRHRYRQNTERRFMDRDYVRETRKRFAETVNEVLEEHNCPIRYDPRSYKDMGLDIEPIKNVSRLQADKAKIRDFVVMDPEWTRRMIDREMQVAAVERDKTYQHLKRVERELVDATRSAARVRDANAKLPKGMKLSSTSQMTKADAARMIQRMLKIEVARVSQRFADEATTRTILNVIDATSPTSPHRNGRNRNPRPMPGEMEPDKDATATLHAAATEEMRLHLIEVDTRARNLKMLASGALVRWRRQAGPAPRPPQPPATEPVRMASQSRLVAMQLQPAAERTRVDNTPMGVLARTSRAGPAKIASMARMFADGQRRIEMLAGVSGSPAALAEAVISLIEAKTVKPQAANAPPPFGQPELTCNKMEQATTPEEQEKAGGNAARGTPSADAARAVPVEVPVTQASPAPKDNETSTRDFSAPNETNEAFMPTPSREPSERSATVRPRDGTTDQIGGSKKDKRTIEPTQARGATGAEISAPPEQRRPAADQDLPSLLNAAPVMTSGSAPSTTNVPQVWTDTKPGMDGAGGIPATNVAQQRQASLAKLGEAVVSTAPRPAQPEQGLGPVRLPVVGRPAKAKANAPPRSWSGTLDRTGMTIPNLPFEDLPPSTSKDGATTAWVGVTSAGKIGQPSDQTFDQAAAEKAAAKRRKRRQAILSRDRGYSRE